MVAAGATQTRPPASRGQPRHRPALAIVDVRRRAELCRERHVRILLLVHGAELPTAG